MVMLDAFAILSATGWAVPIARSNAIGGIGARSAGCVSTMTCASRESGSLPRGNGGTWVATAYTASKSSGTGSTTGSDTPAPYAVRMTRTDRTILAAVAHCVGAKARRHHHSLARHDLRRADLSSPDGRSFVSTGLVKDDLS